MSLWIGLVLGAQLIYASVSLIEKFIVSSKRVSRPVVMAFYVGILSSLTIFVFLFGWIPLPFENISVPSFSNVHILSSTVGILSFLSGITFIGALVALYSSFVSADASDVIPITNSTSAVLILILSFYVLDTSISHNFLWGFLFLVVGTFLIARFRFTKKIIGLTILSGILFGTNLIFMKLLFMETNFDNAFFWSRLGIVVSALILLFLPDYRQKKKIKKEDIKVSHKSVLPVLISLKILAGIGSFMILKAVELGDVAIVQALAGLQFVFLLLFSIFFGHKTSVHFGENVTHKDRIQKLVSIGIIVVGFFLLFI